MPLPLGLGCDMGGLIDSLSNRLVAGNNMIDKKWKKEKTKEVDAKGKTLSKKSGDSKNTNEN